MVSQPDHSRSLSLRGPSSVVSRATSLRHRRHGRSHAGGTSYLPQNDFPVFTHTGDVEITVTAGGKENRYLLHKLILTQCSGFFEASTSQEWSRAVAEGRNGSQLARIGEGSGSESGTPVSSKDPKKRWRYELDTGPDSDDIPMLVQKEASSPSLFGTGDANRPPPIRTHNKPPPSSNGFFRSVANLSLAPPPVSHQLSQADEDLLRDYDNLFRIFYNYSPILDAINIADAYIQCKTLLSLADMYDALAVVGPRVDHHLLQFQSRLWKQVAKYSPSYLKLGYLARSRVIYTEALIHVVGQWPVGERHLRNTLPQSILEVIEDKVEDVAEVVSRVEGKLFRLSLLTSRGERVTPANGYMDWLVVSLFRQWLAEHISPPPVSKPPSRHSNTSNSQTAPSPPYTPSPLSHLGRTYRLLGSANPSAYLNHDDCKRFLKLTPEGYTRDALKRFERRLEELKGMAREVVRPLMRCGLHLEDGAGVGYLTCARVEEGDFVWEVDG
jgi:hypothetical protein